MKLLLDTHVLVWLADDDRRLSNASRVALADEEAELLFSAASAWEYEWLVARGRLSTTYPLREIMAALFVEPLGIDFDLHNYSASLPQIHGDPIDRMMIAQALRHDLTLVTADETIQRYPVKWLW